MVGLEDDEMLLQSFQMSQKLFPELYDLPDTSTPLPTKKKKKKKKFSSKRLSSSSAESYMSFGSSSRPNSGSLASSSPLGSSSSGNTHKTTISQFTSKFNTPTPTIPEKKKNDRGPLKVSINEKAELIDDLSHIDKYEDYDDRTYSIDSACSHMHEEREKHTLEDENMKDKNGKKEKVKDENVKHEKTKDTEISNGIEREG